MCHGSDVYANKYSRCLSVEFLKMHLQFWPRYTKENFCGFWPNGLEMKAGGTRTESTGGSDSSNTGRLVVCGS